MEENIDMEFERERNYVIDNKDTLREQYGADYIAVRKQKIIDHDSDQFKLARRIEAKFRSQFVLISTIDDIINPKEDSLPSPEGIYK